MSGLWMPRKPQRLFFLRLRGCVVDMQHLYHRWQSKEASTAKALAWAWPALDVDFETMCQGVFGMRHA